jgi:hypothetical protein
MSTLSTYNSTINSQHFYDLDGTLWQTDAKWWIIDKNDPSKCIKRISQYEGSLIIGGYYKADNLYISYNGLEGWLNKDLWNYITNKKDVSIKDIGISLREFSDVKLIESQAKNITFNIHHISHLENTSDKINLITARGNKLAHTLLLDKLNIELVKLNINVADIHFVNDPTSVNIVGSTSTKKCLIILQSIVGYLINNNQFIAIECDKFNTTYFYDDEDKNIDACNLINQFLKEKIINEIKENKPVLYLNLVTSNKINPFITTKVDIVV